MRELIVRSLMLGTMLATSAIMAGEPYDASVSLEVAWAEGTKGSDGLRADIARSAEEMLSAKNCFREVGAASEARDADLHLDVEMWGLTEETLFDDSIAERADPSRPHAAFRVTAVFTVFVDWSLHTGHVAIAGKRFKIERQRRPMTENEDPSLWAREDAIEAIGRELARAVCSVSRKKINAALGRASR